MTEENGSNNKKGVILRTIFEQSDSTIKLLTLGFVVLTGGGNWFATKSLSDREKQNVKHALQQVYDVQDKLETMDRRQRNMEQTLEEIRQKIK